MKKFANSILRGLIFAQLIFLAFACSKDSNEPANGDSHDPNRDKILINVKTVYSGYGTPLSSRIKEKINSLRIIVLSGNSVTLNEVKEFDEELPAEEFSYLFSVDYSESANRRFYFIANEEQFTASAIGFQPQPEITLPQGLAGKSLTEILNLYPGEVRDDESNETPLPAKANELEGILNSIYFQPSYDIIYDTDDNGDGLETGKISLPYSVYYPETEVTKTEVAKNEQGDITGYSATMYLVPVATKFEFHFKNYRSNPVELSDLKITQFDNIDFLFARVGKSDISKTFDSDKIYWPDWLAKVAEESWNNIESSDQNNTFNTRYGWITDYSIPSASSQNVVQFPPDVSPSTQTIPSISFGENGEELAGELELGPFYLPESKNIVDKVHWYGLNFKVRDTKNKTEFVFESDNSGSPIQIENIGALFRNTHVIISVDMGEGEPIVDGVYAEIMPFLLKEAWGYVGEYVK